MHGVDAQIVGKPHDKYRISLQSVDITGFPHISKTLQGPRNAL